MHLRPVIATIALLVGALLPSAAAGQIVSIDGSIAMSEPTGSGCEFSPDCFAWTHVAALCGSGSDVRDGLTMSFRKVPSVMRGKQAVFAFDALRLSDGAKVIVSFRRFTCVDRTAEYDLAGTSKVTVPHQTEYVAVVPVESANVRWTLAGPIDPS